MLCPRPISVKVMSDYKLYISFDNGENKIFDVTPYLYGDWYKKLKDEKIFNSVRIVNKHIEWKDGQDIAPHELYEQSVAE